MLDKGDVHIAHLQVAEVVQSMEELVTFTKNLSPGMTSMTKQVDARTEDLTNPSHADLLTAESDQVCDYLHPREAPKKTQYNSPKVVENEPTWQDSYPR